MRFGVVGLGSMGKRRVRDLLALGHDVVGFDVREDRAAQARALFGVSTAADFPALLAARPDALVISTPPDRHVEYYERSFDARLPFFSEANVLTPRPEWFAEREAATGVRGYPSGTWRFYPPVAMLRRQVAELGAEQVNAVHAHYAGYLPFWHPWERYDEFYAGRARHTCAAREMVPFELEWVCYVAGRVRAVSAVHGRRAEWTTDIDDSYLLLLEFESGVRGTLAVELHQVAPFRSWRVACRGQSFVVDVAAQELRRYDLAADSWRVHKAPAVRPVGGYAFEDVYFSEIGAFAAAVAGEAEYPKGWADDRHLSDVLYAAEESMRRRAWVCVSDVARDYDGLTRGGE